ncbi:hypothetical protein PGB90_004301 [Kerria lacca]
MQAALMFEVLMYLNSYYFGIFSTWEFITYMFKLYYKGYEYNLEKNMYKVVTECLTYLFFCITEICRIYMGRKSDTSDKPIFIIISLILMIPSSACIIHLLFGQIFIARLERMLCGFQLLMVSCELFFGLIHLCTFRTDKY